MNSSQIYLNARKALHDRHQTRIRQVDYIQDRLRVPPPSTAAKIPIRSMMIDAESPPNVVLFVHARAEIHSGRAETRYRRHLPPQKNLILQRTKSSVNPRFSRWTTLITTPSTPDAHLHYHSTPPFLPPPPHESLSSTGLSMAGLGGGHRSSMLLYRLAGEEDLLPPAVSMSSRDSARLLPPPKLAGNRDSTMSSGASLASFDSQYPLSHSNRNSVFPTAPRGLVPYEYDPAMDELDPIDDEDLLHDPKSHGIRKTRFLWRGVLNVTALMTLILALLSIHILPRPFILPQRGAQLPCQWEHPNKRDRFVPSLPFPPKLKLTTSAGQAPVLFQMPELIDPAMPQEALTRTGFNAHEYSLVFSDEITQDGRSFYPGYDPFWEAVDL
ncbi:hypothetical protein DXG01_005812 [Tephrocybe rancida]|nr:hypothetical protein DXG01_005812 [Tephrocybe rancida]